MKVLLANSERGWRGGENQTLELARALAARHCDVAIAARRGSPLAERAAGEGVACRVFGFEKAPFVTPFALARFISSWRPAVLHAQTADAHTHLWLARAVLRRSPPLVVSRRVAFSVSRAPLSILKYRAGVAHYIPISKAAAESLSRAGVPDSRMTVIPSGVDTARFSQADNPALRALWNLRSGDFVVGAVAAFEPEKGLAILLDAAAALLARGERIAFVLVGEGSGGADLAGRARRLGIEESVTLAAPDRALEETLGAFDIFVLPSLEEGLSTALLAAMAAGLGVVASRTGGIPDALTAECGLLVAPGDAAALADAIAALKRDASLRARLGAAARRRAALFDMAVTAEKTLELYRRIVQGHTGSGCGAGPCAP